MTKLEYWRVTRKLTIKELARKAGIDRSTITRLENGKAVKGVTLGKLAEALLVDPTLLQGEHVPDRGGLSPEELEASVAEGRVAYARGETYSDEEMDEFIEALIAETHSQKAS